MRKPILSASRRAVLIAGALPIVTTPQEAGRRFRSGPQVNVALPSENGDGTPDALSETRTSPIGLAGKAESPALTAIANCVSAGIELSISKIKIKESSRVTRPQTGAS